MNKLLQLFILIENILIVISSNVTLLKNDFLSAPNATSFKLKCVFHLERLKQIVQRVDISKDKHVFYSVEHSHNHAHDAHHSPNGNPVINFKRTSGIRELEGNKSEIDWNRSYGWTSVFISKRNDKPIPGTYRCKVHYMEGTKHATIESDKVQLEDKREKVEFEINHGHEKFRKGANIKMECKYKLLKQDKFAGLSLVKDKQEFFRYFNDKNHSFVHVPGIEQITWSSYAKKINLQVKKAKNTTAGYYACLFNFTNPNSEDKVISLSDVSHIVFKNSKESRLAKTWLLVLLIMIYVIY